jgi:HPt (histidine-containing phosphotransfer) domain-containing protein
MDEAPGMDERPGVIDVEVLDELERSVGDDRQFVRELVETYLDDTPKLIANIRSGIADGDVERTNRAAHTLKSNSASVGAMGLSAMARELETMTSMATTVAHDLAEPEVGTLADVITAEFEEVRDELNRLIPAPAAE